MRVWISRNRLGGRHDRGHLIVGEREWHRRHPVTSKIGGFRVFPLQIQVGIALPTVKLCASLMIHSPCPAFARGAFVLFARSRQFSDSREITRSG
jgi:hypothetical protein